jgi:hypothetical protein
VKRILVLLVALCCALPASAQADFSEYEISSASASLSSYQAGAHADFNTSFTLKSQLAGGDVAQTREVAISLPPGLVGNVAAIPKCTMLELGQNSETSHCPQDSQVGITELLLEERSDPVLEPIYNMVSPGGDIVARFGFLAGFYPTTINVRLRSEGDYGVTATIEGAASAAGLRASNTTIWGVPGDPVHDPERVTPEEGEDGDLPPGGGRASTRPPVPFLTNPTRCGVPLEVGFSASTYQLPEMASTKTVSLGTLSGCGKLTFQPSFTATPTTPEAAAPSGLDVNLAIPQNENVNGLATSHLRDAKVVLPEGMTLAAGAADGLQGCSAEQAGYKARRPGACPPASKLGTADFDVPSLERPIEGAVYQRTPEPGHLFRVWIVADELGAHVALPGEIQLDPKSGRITSTFLDNPQVPLRRLQLHLFGGPRAPLATPSVCGSYATHWELTPWSGASPVFGDAPMIIDQGCGKNTFSPELSAGSTSARAGGFTPFSFILRSDSGEQNISELAVTLPPGLLAKLRGVPVCADAAAAAGSCPGGSRIGSVAVASGPGSNPLWIPQPGKEPPVVYLGGPYKGAPYSMVIRVPAQAGPFDLGTVVVRSAIRISPETARVTVDSDPLPQMLEGVPTSYREIRVLVDRRNFILNPTNCGRHKVKAKATSILGVTAEPTDGFRVRECGALKFQPKLALKLMGGTARADYPALSATLQARKRDANIRRVVVALPHSEFLAQEHIQTICTRVQFAAENCPAGSIYGYAKAWTPLLGKPLAGPVYLRSSSHPLPDLVAALDGQIDIDLVGRIDSVNEGIRTTFGSVPDAPVTKFILKMKGGKKGLLVNSQNICRGTHRADVEMQGQNGKLLTPQTLLAPSCSKR